MGKIKRIFLAILFLLIACNGWAGTRGSASDIGAYESTFGVNYINTGVYISGASF